MADRRMFSKSVVDSDLFLDMPPSAQNLYFHLGMRADDDGFVNNPKKVMRIASCADDDLRVLIAKGFLIAFDNGVVVVTHWRVHNHVQKDRYKRTLYTDELAALKPDSNGVYSLYPNCIQTGYELDTNCIQSVSKVDTQVRVGKSRVGKSSIGEGSDGGDADADASAPSPSALYGQYQNVRLTDDEMQKLQSEFPTDWQSRIERLSEYIAQTGKKYKSHLATIRAWARRDATEQAAKTNQNPALDYIQREYNDDDFRDDRFMELAWEYRKRAT